MKVLVSATNKGGEGKTTVSLMFSEYAAIQLGKRVLCIDLDSQANLSERYVPMVYDQATKDATGKMPSRHPDYNPDEDVDWDGFSSIGDIFLGQGVVPYPTAYKNIEILPAHASKLELVENVTKREAEEKVHDRLKEFLKDEDVRKSYDLVVIDTPPSKKALTVAAFKAATHVVMPARMEDFSIQGLLSMLQFWKQEKYAREGNGNTVEPIQLVGILANQYRATSLHMGYYDSLKKHEQINKYLLPYKIPLWTRFSEILSDEANPKSIFELSDQSKERKVLSEIFDDIATRIFSDG